MKKIILSIEGMTCSACSNGLEKFLNKQKGINSASVNLVMATASIECDDDITIDMLNKFVKEAGFKSLGVANLKNNDKKNSFIPYIIFGILALMLMYISMAKMWHLPLIKILDAQKSPIFYCLSLFVLTIPFLIYGFGIIKSGIKNLIHRMPNMDTLVSIGVISSFLYSCFGVIMIILGHDKYIGSLYFESTVFVIYFVKVGRFIDNKAKEKTKDAIKKLVNITPQYAKIKTKDGIKEITIDEVKKKDVLICLAGDKIAVDGTILEGKSHFDESFITGESKPVLKQKNDKVLAGSINYDENIEYVAEKIGKDSTISEVINLVIEATNTKAPISLLADKISSYFVPLILIIASITLLFQLIIGYTFFDSLTNFVTVLVVACPCALGLATPLAIIVSEGVCASSGIMVKSSESLEIASKVDTIVFDKTGTLTYGKLSIAKIYNYSKLSNKELLSLLGSIEQYSNHPIAKSVMNYIIKNKINIDKNFKTANIDGKGIKATSNKVTYYAGSSSLIQDLEIKNNHKNEEITLENDGCSVIYIVKNKEILGLIGIKDTIRKDAPAVIQQLKKMNIDIIMLTGDNEITAQRIAKELGIDKVMANVMPKQKADVINKLKNDDRKVMMVGDGINDAPSLTLAHIGATLSSGTDIAIDSADIVLINNQLSKINDFILISKRTLKTIKENLFWAFLYNVCMIPVAMGLFKHFNISINPMIASIAMIFSSLFVTLNSLRIKKRYN